MLATFRLTRVMNRYADGDKGFELGGIGCGEHTERFTHSVHLLNARSTGGQRRVTCCKQVQTVLETHRPDAHTGLGYQDEITVFWGRVVCMFSLFVMGGQGWGGHQPGQGSARDAQQDIAAFYGWLARREQYRSFCVRP